MGERDLGWKPLAATFFNEGEKDREIAMRDAVALYPRSGGYRVRSFKRQIRAGGAEIAGFVIVVYEREEP